MPENKKQQADAVDIGGAAVKIEFEGAEQRIGRDAGKPVAAARPVRRLVGRLMEKMDDGDGQHQLRQAVRAQQNGAGQQSRDAAHCCADEGHEKRVGDTVVGSGNAGGIGAGTEQGRMAKCRHAAIAGNEIDGEHEKRYRDDARQQRQIIREQEVTGDGGDDDEQRTANRAQGERPSAVLPFQ